MAHVLIPIDESDPSSKALDYVLRHHADDSITVLHVVDHSEIWTYGGMEGSMMIDFEEIHTQQHEAGQAILDDAIERVNVNNVEISTELITGRPANAILEFVEDNAVDHIVIGSHGRTGASRILLGSVAEIIARRSPVPVTIIR